MGDKISKGDWVQVNFANRSPICGVVLHMPSATGDCWHIKVPGGAWAQEELHYVQNFESIQLVKDPNAA